MGGKSGYEDVRVWVGQGREGKGREVGEIASQREGLKGELAKVEVWAW